MVRAISKALRPCNATPVVIRNIPPGHHWGWYSREDPRMHLQSTDGEHDYKVWLEEKGKRVFQPEGAIPRKVLKALTAEVKDHRRFIEDKWVRQMLDLEWLDLHIALPSITLIAYPHTPNKLIRKIDLASWLNQRQLLELRTDSISLDREMAALRLWADRSEEQVPYDVRQSSLLWHD